MLDPFKSIGEIIRLLVHLELKSDAGRLNYRFVLFIFILFLVLAVTDIFTLAMAKIDPVAESNKPNLAHLLYVMIGLMVLCVGLIAAMDYIGKKYNGPRV